MKRTSINGGARAWIVDYSAARARAIEWLGDRYLLAKPINVGEYAWRRNPLRKNRPGAGGWPA